MRIRRSLAGPAGSFILVLGLAWPTAVAAGTAPSEPCVPGTVWVDTTSGVKYLCIYDELYGGGRWELIPSEETGAEGMTYRSPATGCVYGMSALRMLFGGAGNSFARSLAWPCTRFSQRLTQPAGELRVRTVIQSYTSYGWSTCRDTGYQYNPIASSTWVSGFSMGSTADCGSAYYRVLGTAQMWQGSLWVGSTLTTPWLRLQ